MSEYQQSASIANEAERLRLIGLRANQVTQAALAAIAARGTEVSSVVVAGCGTGNEFRAISEAFPGAEIVGVDQSDKALELAEKTGLATQLVQAEISTMSTNPDIGAHDPFDLYYVRQTLFHQARPADSIAEAKKIVKPKGTVLAQEPDWGAADANWPDFAAFKASMLRGMRSRAMHPTLGKHLRGLFAASGLVNIHEEAFTDRVESTDDRWITLGFLVDVAGSIIEPFLEEHGFTSPEELKQCLEAARKVPENFFIPPPWYVVSGTTESLAGIGN